MRIDKFLWSVRFYKTRTISTEECNKNRVSISDVIVKPSREVNIGDVIIVRKNQVNCHIQVIQIPASRVGAKLVQLYIKDITPKEELDALKLRMLSRNYYNEKGEGRPTKKDRRDLDDFTNISDD